MLWVQLVTGALISAVLIFCIAGTRKLTKLEHPATVFSYGSSFAFYFHAFFRVAILALCIAILVIEVFALGTKMFSYYTIWNFILQTIYYVWALKYQFSTAQSRNEPVATTKETHYLNTLFDVCFSNSILVVGVFWGFLYHPGMHWYGYFEHGGNTLAFIIEFVSNHFLISRRSWFFTIFFAAIYSIFIWISYATWLHGVWPYFFLSMDTPYAPLWYIGIFGGHVLMYGVALGFSRVKEHCLPAMIPVAVSHIKPQVNNPISYV
ncbi:hypothetical protein THRCLA_22013 [Thraustotheca clavata]|uniref:Uncharacterized protein n=1 Tax=Thraustotheca clavata TaxID=74557 RepID=A0A1V9ZE79_9STRA|nr:hypothetical protein THRCLA_22013 [Thraustotheca clavata]